MHFRRFVTDLASPVLLSVTLFAAGSAASIAAEMPKAAKACKACHSFEAGQHRIGPSLFGVIGRVPGTAEGYTKYSEAMSAYGMGGKAWDRDMLFDFLAAPRQAVEGTKMAYPGQKNPEKREQIIEFLTSLTD